MSEELHAAARSNRPSFPSQSQSNNALYSHPQQQTPRTLQSTDSTGTNSKRSDQLQIPSATRRSNSNAQLRWQSSHTEQEQRSTAVSLQTSTSVLEIDEEEGFADLREGDDVYKFNPSVVSLTNGTRAAGIDDEVAGSVVISVPQITLPRSAATSVQLVPAVPARMVDNTAELDQEASYKSAFSIKSLPFMKKAKQKFLRKPISQSSKGLAWWNFAIDILHLTLLIMIPVQLAWTHHFVNDEWVVFYLLIDAIMVTDCYILARVDFKDEYGILIHDSDRILKRYLFECSGILHIMASLPWELVHYAVWSENPVTLSALGPSESVDPLL
ncbi:hypothetical protein CcCBS67573_g01633 [Chytriomyces confervae]|uniref:Ion transport domain-containing protein n=1 Tax=Chytriomyces confervae TaxID=246404 RepID=A0A507FLE3_9FUNG|nr:hypothetical protein CcCBS67573_g01633 [Chytriomyces confervae]